MNRSRPEFSALLLALLLAACTGTGDAGGGDAEPPTIAVSMDRSGFGAEVRSKVPHLEERAPGQIRARGG